MFLKSLLFVKFWILYFKFQPPNCWPSSPVATTPPRIRPTSHGGGGGVKQTAFNNPSMIMVKSKDGVNSKWMRELRRLRSCVQLPALGLKWALPPLVAAAKCVWVDFCSSPSSSAGQIIALLIRQFRRWTQERRGELCSAGVSGAFRAPQGEISGEAEWAAWKWRRRTYRDIYTHSPARVESPSARDERVQV